MVEWGLTPQQIMEKFRCLQKGLSFSMKLGFIYKSPRENISKYLSQTSGNIYISILLTSPTFNLWYFVKANK